MCGGGGGLAEKTNWLNKNPFDLFPYKSDVSYCTNSDYNKQNIAPTTEGSIMMS